MSPRAGPKLNVKSTVARSASRDRKSTRLNSSHGYISYAVFCLKKKSSVPTTLPTAYDVYPLDGRHDGGYYTVKDCVTIDVLPRTPGNNVYVGFMVWSNFTATKCRGLVSLNQVIKEIICLQFFFLSDLSPALFLALSLLPFLLA